MASKTYWALSAPWKIGYWRPSKVIFPRPWCFLKWVFYHPEYDKTVFTSLQQFLSWKGETAATDKVKVGLLMQRAMIETMSTELVDAAVAEIEAKGCHSRCRSFFELSPMSKDYTDKLMVGGEAGKTSFIDSIINFRSIHWAAKRQQEFKKLNVPVLQALTYYDGDQQAWEADSQGGFRRP